ncbi:MAG: YlxR family protein [Dehalococcoidia bacterium]|jgi:uncharacterized protein
MKMKKPKSDNIVQATRPKHVPQRTCVACRQTRSKRELLRLVCSNNIVELDLRGKKPGRGVYICSRRKCWETGLKGNRIEFGLRTKLTAENRGMLLEYGESLAEKEN